MLAAAAAPPGAAEAKFAALRTSNSGRKRILALLQDEGLSRAEVRLCIYHKAFMITTKIVDALVETWHHRNGIDLYENAAHLGLANLLHQVIPVHCGSSAFQEWQKRFVVMVRDKSAVSIDAFYEQTRTLREQNTSTDFDIFLAMLGHTRAVVDEGIRDGDRVALDPAVPALVQLAAEWTAALGTPFDLVHDHSKPIDYERERLALLMSVEEVPRRFDHMGVSYAFPLQAPAIRFADSRDVPQLQIADLMAGATAALFRARARREKDAFVEAIVRTRLPGLVTNAVWPDTAVSPEDLDAKRRPGSAQLDFITSLAARRAAALGRGPDVDPAAEADAGGSTI